MMPRRIAIAGFQHETNTFAPSRAGWDEFAIADAWPGLLMGDSVIEGTRGMNLPIAGAVNAAEKLDFELVPILWCAAEPSGFVTDDAFSRISALILEGIQSAGPIDGIYLDLHGAMVTESHEDGESAVLEMIRNQIGPDLPIGVSLDLHANVSACLIDLADVTTIYRTYPHLDMADTGHRCVLELERYISGVHRHRSFRQLPFLIPLHAQFTGSDPCQRLYRMLETLPSEEDEYLEFAMGFTAADIADCGPSVLAHAHSKERAEFLAGQFVEEAISSASQFEIELLHPDDAVCIAMQADGTVVLADVQDNPGAGGSSDTTGILHALREMGAQNAVVGVICDREFANAAIEVGPGAIINKALGGKSGVVGDALFKADFEVLRTSDGTIRFTGEMYGGSVAEMGPSCLVSLSNSEADIRIVVGSHRIQCLDQALFTHFGIDLNAVNIICVKSTVHYRADFDPISDLVLNVKSPGLFPCDLTTINYQNVKRALL